MSATQGEASALPAPGTDPRVEVAKAQERWISAAPVDIRSDWVELGDGSRVHYLSAGSGEPLIMLHGSGNSSSDWVPLMAHSVGRTYVAVDRPGFGLSDPVDFEPARIREASVGFVSGFLDAMGITSVDLAGNSGGSVMALWTALDRPERVKSLALLGATPLLPGTTVPFPLRVMTSRLGPMASRLLPNPSPKSVIKMMGAMGEARSVAKYPKLVDVFVAAAFDVVAAEASGREMAAMVRGLMGFRPEVLFRDEDLVDVRQPTMLIWGDRDPVGDVEVARRLAGLLSDSELHVVSAGHAPWWGEPELAANVLADFYARL